MNLRENDMAKILKIRLQTVDVVVTEEYASEAAAQSGAEAIATDVEIGDQSRQYSITNKEK